MTTLEEMEAAWQAMDAKLNQTTLLLTNQLQQESLSRIKTPLRRLIVSLWIEVALSAIAMLVVGSFLADHIAQTRFVWPAAIMDLWFAATLIASIRQWIAATSVKFDDSVSLVQQKLDHLRILRLKAFRLLFLTGQIVWWIPFLITALKMFFQIDAYRFLPLSFIWINLLAGLALIPLLLFIAKKVRPIKDASWFRKLADIVAGQSLAEAQRQAEALAAFSR